jgi:serine/threonine protein kinase
VNRKRVQQADLSNGDVIRGGKTQIRVRIHSEDIRETRRQVVPVADPEDGEVTLPPMANPVVAEGGTGQAIGPFQIVREIGRGGMGVVYLAQRPGDTEPVALKTIRPDIDISERDVRLFLREADVLKALQHPRIIRFVEISEDNGQLYFATEYVPASDAGTLLKERGPLPRSAAIALAC